MSDTDTLAAAWLAERGLADVAERCALAVTDNAKVDVGLSLAARPAIVIPYHNPDGTPLLWGDNDAPYVRVRYLDEEPKGFVPKRGQRYSQVKGSPVEAYLCPLIPWEQIIADPKINVIVTEGEAKAIAACNAGIPCVGLGGVSNIGKPLLPALRALSADRIVFIVFDSDAADNAQVLAAEQRLADEMTRHGADVRSVRLPPGDGGAKQGLDDYLMSHTFSDLEKLCVGAASAGAVERAVTMMNGDIAWIESESCIFNKHTKKLFPKASLLSGSKYSAINVTLPATTDKPSRSVSLGPVWLKHPRALRYDGVIFRPDGSETVDVNGETFVNIWTGFNAEEGDVAPFFDLNAHVFSKLPVEHRDFAIKLMAYKAQNPTQKVPIAVVMTGPSGSGKSLWCNVMCAAFEPYSHVLPPSALIAGFNGWAERSLIVFIDEAKGDDITKGAEALKAMISEKRVQLNEKFRPAQQVDCYATFMLSSNKSEVGAYDHDDRRMFVTRVPPPLDKPFYQRVGKWLADGGGRHVMHYLLTYDLNGWEPPQMAPITSEKTMAHEESLGPIEAIAKNIKTNDQSVIVEWIKSALDWAQATETGPNTKEAARARDVRAAVSRMQVRPWYTGAELAKLLPAIIDQQGFKLNQTPAGEISKRLRDSGIEFLECLDDPRGFLWHGKHRQYLVISRPDDFGKPLTQAEFERHMRAWPTYGQMLAAQ